jgi:hypothetical protein
MSLTADELTIVNALTQERPDGASLRDQFRGNDDLARSYIADYIPQKIAVLQNLIAIDTNSVNVTNARIADSQAFLTILSRQQATNM